MRRIVTLFVLAALVPLVFMSAVFGVVALRGQGMEFERQARDQARLGAALLTTRLSGDMRAVDMLSASAAFDPRYPGGFDRERFAMIAARVLSSQKGWRAISVSNAAGERVLDLPRPIGGRLGPIVERASHARAVRSKKVVVGSLASGPRGRLALAIRAPVIRQDEARFVVSAVVDPAELEKIVTSQVRHSQWNLELVDPNGRVVVDTGEDPPGALAGAAFQEARAAGVGALSPHLPGGVAGLVLDGPSEGWSVFVSAPSRLYDQPRQGMVLILIIGAAGGLALAMAAIWIFRKEITAQQQHAQVMVESQRLEALGRMTGGVAHDFNNLLTPIIGGLDLLRPRIGEDARSLRLLDGAMGSAERARTLVSRLLAFARRQPLDEQDVELGALVQGLEELLVRTLGPNIALKVDLPGEPAPVRVDPAQVELALINLAVNARDAMPSGGELTITVTEVVANAKDGLEAGRYACVCVRDSGEGMDELTLKRAIEPFFTTKPVGRGTGLGLSMVHGLAAQSGGALKLKSAKGEGTMAEIWLPIARTQVLETPLLPAAVSTGAILVVDDDAAVREATAEILKEHGWAVETAASMSQAVALLKHDRPIAAMVTDVVMPGGGGAELIAEARRLRPDLAVLVISGYAPRLEQIPANVRRLAKPFRSAELIASVQRLVAGDTDAVPD